MTGFPVPTLALGGTAGSLRASRDGEGERVSGEFPLLWPTINGRGGKGGGGGEVALIFVNVGPGTSERSSAPPMGVSGRVWTLGGIVSGPLFAGIRFAVVTCVESSVIPLVGVGSARRGAVEPGGEFAVVEAAVLPSLRYCCHAGLKAAGDF